jgi:hypothetical protein
VLIVDYFLFMIAGDGRQVYRVIKLLIIGYCAVVTGKWGDFGFFWSVGMPAEVGATKEMFHLFPNLNLEPV